MINVAPLWTKNQAQLIPYPICPNPSLQSPINLLPQGFTPKISSEIWANFLPYPTQLINGGIQLAGKGAETQFHPHLQVLDSAVTSLQENPQANNRNENSGKQDVKQNYGNPVKKNTPTANENHYIEQNVKQKAEVKTTPMDVTIFPDKLLDCFDRWPARLLLFVDGWGKHNQRNPKKTYYYRDGFWWTCASTKFITENTNMNKTAIGRARDYLRIKKVLITKTFNEGHGDQTLWYRIDYEQLSRLKPQICSFHQNEAG